MKILPLLPGKANVAVWKHWSAYLCRVRYRRIRYPFSFTLYLGKNKSSAAGTLEEE